jgi:NarL family two-component system sensor histidine kinase YdfH
MENTRPPFDPDRETRPFFWFMTLVLAVMYALTLIQQPALRQPLLLALFSVLLIVHILLHWALRVLAEQAKWVLPYLILQGALACAITLLSQNIGMMFGLFMALVGEAIGVYGLTRRGLVLAAAYLAISLVNYSLLVGVSQIIWWLLGAGPTVVFVVLYVQLYSRQMNANIRAQALLTELEAANRQLTEYAAQVEDLTIAAERQRMARELHDTLSQGLAGLILRLEAADAHLAGGHPEKARGIVQQTMEMARITLADARRAIDDLRRGGAATLEESITLEAARFTQATGIPCPVEILLPRSLPTAYEDTVLRILSEGLANIARHAQARRAWVILSASVESVTIEIGDDGRGFDLQTADQPGHYGLLGMRERARLVGGSLAITSSPGQGCTLRLALPLVERDLRGENASQ